MSNLPKGPRHQPQGMITRGTTAPNRLRRVDNWIIACYGQVLASAESVPLVVDLGFGASPVTTVELYERLRIVRPDIQVVGLDIDPQRVEKAQDFLESRGGTRSYPGLSFALGGFELPVQRLPLVVRAFNVLRQYKEEEAWQAWNQLCLRLAPGGILVEGTSDEIGRRAVWVTLGRGDEATLGAGQWPREGGARAAARQTARPPAPASPRTLTFAAHLPTLPRPSELAERLPKTLIHRNVPGEPIHEFLAAFDHAWATAAPFSVFGPRQRWIAAVEILARSWPVFTYPPLGGRKRWRLGEVTVPWAAVAPAGVPASAGVPAPPDGPAPG